MVICPVVNAEPTRSFSTVSNRIRGERPYTVPLRRNVGEKLSDAMGDMARSHFTLDRAYSVCGSRSDSSVATAASDMPYMMQDDESRKRCTPASFAISAK